ncbi:hypothetical protein FRC20_009560 [Serendipita sp. 405]|nr:hypothetical protein FRC20_009560 [Serendipita sp. 405]
MFQAIMTFHQNNNDLVYMERSDMMASLFFFFVIAKSLSQQEDMGGLITVTTLMYRLAGLVQILTLDELSIPMILTIREAARSQGFPDRVEFECVGNSVSRITQQIGNSVPPPIAAAIGREIQKAWLEDMEEHNREGSRGSISWHEGKYYLNSAELERFVTPEPPECCRFEIHSMPPKAKGKKGKKQDDDDFWSNAGESLSTTDPVKTGAHVGADEDDAGPSNRHGFAGLDIGAGEQDEEDPDSFMAMLQKRKDKKKTKKGTNDENDEKGLDESTAAVELKPAKEMTAEDLADEEFGPIKEKGKKKKGKDKKTVSKPAPDEEGDQENAQTAAPTDAPGDDASGDEGDGGPKLLSKKEKEKLKKEKERAKKKAQAAAKKTQTGGEEGEDGDAKAAAPPPPTDPNASETKEKEDDEDGGEADAAAKKKKKKKKAKKEDDDEAPAPASAPVATTSKKKAPAGIAALKAALEQKRLAEEEAKRKLEEERRRIEEEERLAAEAERKKEEERQRKKDKEKVSDDIHGQYKGKSLPDAKSGPAQATKKPVPTAGKPASKAQPPPESSSEGESDSESESESESDDSDDSDEESSSDDGLTTAKRMEAERKAAAATRRRQREEEAKAAASKDNLRSPICCILGHVDTGKTKLLDKIRQTNVQEGEAGGITQQIGATYFPVDAIRTKTAVVNKNGSFEFKIPGLLIIDTPGHESFTNLRSRGSSLCNIAILVVDIMHGLEPQTIESLNLLRNGSTPFIIALNKIDRIYGWNATPDNGAQDSLSKQTTAAQREFADRAQKAIIQIAEQGLNSELYWKNTDPRRVVNIVPTSAITGEGVPDMIKLLVELTQTRMVNSLMYISTLECTVLEVKVVEGLGTTIDVILSNGYLREGDKIVICGLSGPIVTQVRALLMPQPLRELRIKSAYVHNKEVKAANGVKIVAPDLDKAIAGSKLLVCGPDDDEDDLIEEVMKPLEDLLKRISKTQVGVHVQASTLGSLEALLSFLETSKIPVSGIQIGPVHQKDVKRAMTQLEKAQEMAVILCFDVPVDKEAEKLAEESGVKLFRADIIYHLFDKFTAYHKEITEAKRKDAAPQAVWPCRLKVIAVFAKRDPIIVGVDILEGTLRVGTPLCVVNAEKQIIKLGRITSLEINHKTMDIVKKSQAGGGVAVKIEHAVYETPKMVGRHFTEADEVLSLISRQSIDVLKETFRNDVTKEEWLLIKNLKARLQIP